MISKVFCEKYSIFCNYYKYIGTHGLNDSQDATGLEPVPVVIPWRPLLQLSYGLSPQKLPISSYSLWNLCFAALLAGIQPCVRNFFFIYFTQSGTLTRTYKYWQVPRTQSVVHLERIWQQTTSGNKPSRILRYIVCDKIFAFIIVTKFINKKMFYF